MTRSLTIPIAIVAAGAIVAGAVYFSVKGTAPWSNGSGSNPALVRPVDSTDHIFGNPAAKITIVEYADFECDFCKGFSDTLHEIVANEGTGGEVSWVFREFPLSEIHPNALSHAEAAECAAKVGGNDAFWKFADSLFMNQPVKPSQYGALAQAAGVPGDEFATCFADASSTVAARIAADRANAFAVGAQGTPYSLILSPGRAPIVMKGAYSYDAVKQLLDPLLQ